MHVLGEMSRGGTELRTLEVMRRTDPSEVRFVVCALSGRAGNLDGDVQALGGQVLHMRVGLCFPVRFIRALRKHRVDVVHSHVHYSSGPILALAQVAGIRTRIAHFRTSGDGRENTRLRRAQRRLARWILDISATDIVAVAESAMRSSWPASATDPRCRVIRNGIDMEEFEDLDAGELRRSLGLRQETRVALHVGNQTPAKNHMRVLEIFSNLASSNGWHLVMAGYTDPTVDKAIDGFTKDQRIADRVTRLGVRDDIPSIMAGSDVLLFPSLREGLPGVLLEAAAAGLPVVASDIPANREVAELVGDIALVALESPDLSWADEVERASSRARRSRREIEAAFEAAGLTIEAASAAHRSLWCGE